MRVVAGKYRGFVFPKAKGFQVRPTTDRAKESLFNVLHHRIDWENEVVIDLFSGTGNMAAEFLSRGVKEVISVDASARSVAYIKGVRNKLQATNWTIIKQDSFRFIEEMNDEPTIVFADPPYHLGKYPELVQQLIQPDGEETNRLVIIEHPTTVELSEEKRWRQLVYGQSAFSIYSLGHEQFTTE